MIAKEQQKAAEAILNRSLRIEERLKSEHGLDLSECGMDRNHEGKIENFGRLFGLDEDDILFEFSRPFDAEYGDAQTLVALNGRVGEGVFMRVECPTLVAGPYGYESPFDMVGTNMRCEDFKTLEDALGSMTEILKQVGILRIPREESRGFVPAIAPVELN